MVELVQEKEMAAVRDSHKAREQWSGSGTDDSASAVQDRDQNFAEVHGPTKEYASAANFAGIRKLKVDTTHH